MYAKLLSLLNIVTMEQIRLLTSVTSFMTEFVSNTLLKEFCLLEYNSVYSTESQQTFYRNISPPFLGLQCKPRKKPA
jgi:hypothetical protein